MWVIVRDPKGELHKIPQTALKNEFKDCGFVVVSPMGDQKNDTKRKTVKK